jgi:hypothetical protein
MHVTGPLLRKVAKQVGDALGGAADGPSEGDTDPN